MGSGRGDERVSVYVIRAAILAVLVVWAVSCGGTPTDDPASPVAVGEERRPQKASEPVLMSPGLNLRLYPDMAVPGSEIVVEAQVIEHSSQHHPTLSFRLTEDPCGGQFTTEGKQASYSVPQDCRGARIVIQAVVQGDFPEVVKEAVFTIKRAGRLESVVLKHPMPGDRLTAPVFLRWDHALYANRGETLSVKVTRGEESVADRSEMDPLTVLEVDLPPSPEPVWMEAATSGGSVMNLQIRVWKRSVPEIPAGALVLDDFRHSQRSSGGSSRVALDGGGRAEVFLGERISSDGGSTFGAVRYQVSKVRTRKDRDSRLGMLIPNTQSSTSPPYTQLEVWLRGDPYRGAARPIYVEVTGTGGSSRQFKVGLLKDVWGAYHFPLARALRSGESVKSVSIYVRGEDVQPHNGLFLVGAVYLKTGE